MKPRIIEHIEVFPVHVPVTRTFNFASGSAGAEGSLVKLVFVKVTDSEGCHGWGDGRPVPQWAYETPESVVSSLRNHLAPAVTGLDIWDRRQLHARMHAAIGRGPSTGMPVAKAALDMAVHDLCARAAGLPLRAFLGGSAANAEVALSWTVAVKSPSDIGEDVATAREAGFAHFNFKVGMNARQDEELARAARESVPPDSFLWMDANQGLEFPRAVRLARMLEEQGASVLEQPLAADQMHQMRRLRSQTAIPLAVDESSVSPGDYFAYAAEGLVDYYVLKLTRTGGLWPTLLQLGVALSAGHGLLVSGLTDSMEFHRGGVPLFRYVARSKALRDECPKPYFHPLRLGTYESEEGLAGSHYTGLFLRLSRDFLCTGEKDSFGAYLADGRRGAERTRFTALPPPGWLA